MDEHVDEHEAVFAAADEAEKVGDTKLAVTLLSSIGCESVDAATNLGVLLKVRASAVGARGCVAVSEMA